MIIKSFEFNKIDKDIFKIYLFYGKNEGLQKQIIEENFLKNFDGEVIKYDEQEFIYNNEIIISEFMNKSLFQSKKIIIISRVTEKIYKYIKELVEKDLTDIKIILKSGFLEKQSKLRNFFEKNKSIIITPHYEDNSGLLSSIIINFLNQNKIRMSREAINLLVDRASGDRQNLQLELNKILNFSYSNKNLNLEIVKKLSNLAENYAATELANNYLAKNTKNVVKILNENNYSNEDCILILRTISNKSKILINFIKRYQKTKNLDQIISSAKPPIFWKDKDKIKIQVNAWTQKDLSEKIYELNEIETFIKTYPKNSFNLISNFVLNY